MDGVGRRNELQGDQGRQDRWRDHVLEKWEDFLRCISLACHTEDWTGFRLVLAGYTVDQLESLDVGDRGILDEWVSACGGLWRLGLWATQVWTEWGRCTRRFPEAMDHLGSVWGYGDAGHFMRAGLCFPGRWDPSKRQYGDGAGWGKLERSWRRL